MNKDGAFKERLYAGKASFIDSENGNIVASGEGSFDTEKLELFVRYRCDLLEEVSSVRIVIETRHGYFSPVLPFKLAPIAGDTMEQTFSMKECMTWPLYRSLKYALISFKSITIFIKARHNGTPWKRTDSADHTESSIELTDSASYRLLAKDHYSVFSVDAYANYGTNSDRENVDTEMIIWKRMNFILTHNTGEFNSQDVRTVWRAFQAYWLVCHDYITCEVTKVTLGTDLEIIFQKRELGARAKGTDKYKPAISIKDELYLGTLAKMIHFYLNPENKKSISSSSKVGLAIARTVGRRYGDDCKILDHIVADTIISLQSFCESCALKQMSTENKTRRQQTEREVREIVSTIAKLNGISDHVRNFYVNEPSEIRKAIDRPSIERSIEITAGNYGIDLTPYSQTLKVMKKARSQVVHSQDYNVQDIVGLLTQDNITYEYDEKGDIKSISFGIKRGALEELYDLLHLFFTKYFENYKY